MFRGVEDRVNKKLICKVCGYIEYNFPKHHEIAMRWITSGSFNKEELLKCQKCEYSIPISIHCNVSMFYSEGDYLDLPEFTKKDYQDIHK
jgi:hypothetical protein